MKSIAKFFKPFLRRKNISSNYFLAKNPRGVSSKKIVYIMHSSTHQSGGDKVIYKQSQVINEIALKGISSELLHVENVKFKHEWFKHDAKFKTDLSFNPDMDFVVLPEIWSVPHAKKLQALGIKYALFVQNAYFMDVPMVSCTQDDITDAYENAALILSISDDTTECLKLAFPACVEKINRIYCAVDANKFKLQVHKQNLITYMPRKLSKHSKAVLFFLKNSLPSNWSIQAIDGLNEDGVVELLSRSKIFLSFSEFEGLGLPPIEAAMSGNYVIGYTGEGGREYWQYPLFTEIACGNIKDFVIQILQKIEYLNQNEFKEDTLVKNLAARYSAEKEKAALTEFVTTVSNLLS